MGLRKETDVAEQVSAGKTGRSGLRDRRRVSVGNSSADLPIGSWTPGALIGQYALVRLGRLTGAMFVALGSGCGGTNCNDVGCSTGILVESADLFAIEDLPLSVTVCVDQVCHTQRIDSSDVHAGQRLVHLYSMVDFDAEHERDVSVTLEVRSERTGDVLADADGTAHLKRLQPNGASCGPTCYFAQLRYDGTNKLLPA